MRSLRNIFLCFFAALPASISPLFCSAQINVQADQTPIALAQKLAGQGVTVFNAMLTCASQANGFFKVTSSNLGLDSGIVLTNGRAATAGSNYGVNGPSSYFASTDNNMPGDLSLNVLAGEATLDACTLEFDVIPNGDTIRFNYVFSSEEYKNAVCGPYNDAFAFFISGPGIASSDNMALVPGTNIPVTINSINNGIPGSTGHLSNCTNMGPGSPFTAYYIDNATGTTLTHLGFTKVLQAIHTVIPCKTYHLKLSIADAGDALYDSGVFLEAGSLETGKYNISALPTMIHDTSSTICVKGCLPGQFKIKRLQTDLRQQKVKYVIAGSAVNGYDYSTIADSVIIPANDSFAYVSINGLPTLALGPKNVQLYVLAPFSCPGENNVVDSATITIYDTLHISIRTPDTSICGNDSIKIKVNGPDFPTYSWMPGTALDSPNTKEPVAFPSATTTYQVNASVPGTACASNSSEITLNIKQAPTVLIPGDTTVCYNTSLPLSASAYPAGPPYTYLWTGPHHFSSPLPDTVLRNMSAATQGIYKLVVTNDTNGCKGIATMNVTVNTPDTPLTANPIVECVNTAPTPLQATGTNLLWYNYIYDSIPDNVPPIPSTNIIANFTYYVTQTIDNCESPKKKVDVAVLRCCDGNIAIPNAFTPNNDGKNDRFEIYTDYGYTIENMSVFNRWGQVVYSGSDGIWDGTYKGMPAETGTYYYRIAFKCILGNTVERKGDIMLIR